MNDNLYYVVLIIGGGVSGISCAVQDLQKIKNFAADKEVMFSPIKIIITTGSCF
jgi:hypothetical protein